MTTEEFNNLKDGDKIIFTQNKDEWMIWLVVAKNEIYEGEDIMYECVLLSQNFDSGWEKDDKTNWDAQSLLQESLSFKWEKVITKINDFSFNF